MNLLTTLRSMQQNYETISRNDTLNETEAAKYEMIRGLLKSVDNGCIQEPIEMLELEPEPGECRITITGGGYRTEIADALRNIAGALDEPQIDTNELMPVSDISGTWGEDCTLTVSITQNPLP